jgi:hypothetical protein
MNETTDFLVFLIVVGARFLIPLTIFRYPLPGILAALILDAIDQTIFQTFTNLNLDGYQGYDKALDIYYLAIAYISTLRNWTNQFAFKVSRFLWYYRLLGVTLFELTYVPPGPRWLLLIFPNTFEYFFIYLETARLKWDPRRLSKRHVILAAAAIWIFIKLPQEIWIHILQLDMTDTIKEVLPNNLWLIPVLIVVVVLLVLFVRWLLKKLPPGDWQLAFDADAHLDEQPDVDKDLMIDQKDEPFFDTRLVEKIVLVGLVTVIFAQILPGVVATTLQIMIGVAFVIALNTLLSHWLARRGTEWRSAIVQFLVMIVVNWFFILVYAFLIPTDGEINVGNTLFFVLMLTLLVTLYDRYRAVYDIRFGEVSGSENSSTNGPEEIAAADSDVSQISESEESAAPDAGE